MTEYKKSLMQRLIEAGYPTDEIDHNCSSLLVYDTELANKVLNEWIEDNGWQNLKDDNLFIHRFTNIDRKAILEIAFQYEPEWKEKYADLINGKEREL